MLLKDHPSSPLPQALLCLQDVLTILGELYQRQSLDWDAWSLVAKGLESSSVGVIAAALDCARVASRDLRHVRLCSEREEVASLLVKHAEHDDLDIRMRACKAICNFIGHPSRMRHLLQEQRVVGVLGSLLCVPNDELQADALCALTVRRVLVYCCSEQLFPSKFYLTRPGWDRISCTRRQHRRFPRRACASRLWKPSSGPAS